MMKKINLNILRDGTVGLSPGNGGGLAEAASFCLDHKGHPQVVCMPADGHFSGKYEITRFEVTDIMRDSFADIQEATEQGACGIALAIAATETEHVAKRSIKGTGFDYWLGERPDGYPFQPLVRLEVSGLISGTAQETNYRLRKKLEQTMLSDNFPGGYLPAFAVIVEFGNPKTLSGIR